MLKSFQDNDYPLGWFDTDAKEITNQLLAYDDTQTPSIPHFFATYQKN
jgi:hypothetical protein